MKRVVLFLTMALFSVSLLHAQEESKREVQSVEVEVAGEAGVALNKLGYYKNEWVRAVRAEVRYNFPSGDFDIGLGARVMRVDRLLANSSGKDAFPAYQLFGVGDYNLKMRHNITMFFGVAAGASCWAQKSAYSISVVPDKWAPYVGPRVGVEAWNRLRVTLSINMGNKEIAFAGIGVGYAIGGKAR